MSFLDVARKAAQDGLEARQALRLARDAAKPSFRSSVSASRAKGHSARDALKAYRDSTGAFMVGETETIEKKRHPPLNLNMGDECQCGGHAKVEDHGVKGMKKGLHKKKSGGELQSAFGKIKANVNTNLTRRAAAAIRRGK